jgi:hypothetical protein
MVKLSKFSKARISRMSGADKKRLGSAANFLADEGIISHGRWQAVMRALRK